MPYEDRYLGLARYAGSWWDKHERPRKRPDPGGLTPSEYDFCTCGSTFQPVEGSRKRRCFECGAWEHERRSWHERTGVPYNRGDALPLPALDAGMGLAFDEPRPSMNGHKVVEGGASGYSIEAGGGPPETASMPDVAERRGKELERGSPSTGVEPAHPHAPSTAHRNETTEAKAARLVREGKVHVLYAKRADLWSAIVEGDTGVYLIARDPTSTRCECPQGTRPHSHSMAAQAVAEEMLS